MSRTPFPTAPVRRALAGLALTLTAVVAGAQYKVTDANGRVTYTDRPPADPTLRVERLGAAPTNEADTVSTLPYDLREPVGRYPVVLYTTSACGPCDSGRQLLRDRGIPYTEKLVRSTEDAEAFRQLSGGSSLPLLTVGQQQVRTGFNARQWNSMLDAAGYPASSALPPGYRPPTPEPMVATVTAPAAASAPASGTEPGVTLQAPPAPSPAPAASGIRF